MGYSFGMIEIIVPAIFVLVIGLFIVNIIKNIDEWNKNNESPKLTVDAKIVSKRTDVILHHHNNDNAVGGAHTTTMYYVTFEVESGDRIELNVKGKEYGLLVDGDVGKLSFQGSRYIGFERNISL